MFNSHNKNHCSTREIDLTMPIRAVTFIKITLSAVTAKREPPPTRKERRERAADWIL